MLSRKKIDALWKHAAKNGPICGVYFTFARLVEAETLRQSVANANRVARNMGCETEWKFDNAASWIIDPMKDAAKKAAKAAKEGR